MRPAFPHQRVKHNWIAGFKPHFVARSHAGQTLYGNQYLGRQRVEPERIQAAIMTACFEKRLIYEKPALYFILYSC